jgi:hypothetical protein
VKQYYEERAVSTALLTYLNTAGWSDIVIKEGWDNKTPIALRDISVYVVRNSKTQLEMGSKSKTFKRPIQVDAYMETEAQAGAIADDIMEFMDDVPLNIVDETAAILGTMECATDSIVSDTLPPNYSNPQVTWWRGVVRGTYESNYLS